jgi:hypothetical protein
VSSFDAADSSKNIEHIAQINLSHDVLNIVLNCTETHLFVLTTNNNELNVFDLETINFQSSSNNSQVILIIKSILFHSLGKIFLIGADSF